MKKEKYPFSPFFLEIREENYKVKFGVLHMYTYIHLYRLLYFAKILTYIILAFNTTIWLGRVCLL